MQQPFPASLSTDPGMIAADRLVHEVVAGRAVVLVDDGATMSVAPLDGGDVLSDMLAISAARADHIGLGDGAALVSLPGASAEALWALAAGLDPPREATVFRANDRFAEAAVELVKLAERLPCMTVKPGAIPGALTAQVSDVLAFRRKLARTYRHIATASVPLEAGENARIAAFRDAMGNTISAVSFGELKDGALLRVHSSCLTGDVFGSLKCDCGTQLARALAATARDGGVLIYTAQEGRGIGLINKLRAYNLQDQGLDTIDANLALGYHDDERDYAAAATVLRHVGLSSVRLLTNNPSKVAGLSQAGITVQPVPLKGERNRFNARYLETKRVRAGHALSGE